jgi:hypothetical protein
MPRLFEPNTRAIGRPPGPTKCDAVLDSLIDRTPSELRDDLARLPGKKQVFHRVVDLVGYACRRKSKSADTEGRGGAGGIRDQRHEGRARRQTRGRVDFSTQNLRNGTLARDRTALSIVCLPRGTNSPGTAIGLGRGVRTKT